MAVAAFSAAAVLPARAQNVNFDQGVNVHAMVANLKEVAANPAKGVLANNPPTLNSDGQLVVPRTDAIPSQELIARLTPEQMQKFKQIAAFLAQDIELASDRAYLRLDARDPNSPYGGHFFVWVEVGVDANGNALVDQIAFGDSLGDEHGESMLELVRPTQEQEYNSDCVTEQYGFAIEKLNNPKLSSYCDASDLRYPYIQRKLKKDIQFWMSQDLNSLKAKLQTQTRNKKAQAGVSRGDYQSR